MEKEIKETELKIRNRGCFRPEDNSTAWKLFWPPVWSRKYCFYRGWCLPGFRATKLALLIKNGAQNFVVKSIFLETKLH